MKKPIVFILILFVTGFSFGQIEAGLLFGLTKGTTSEISSLTGMEEGQMLYNTDTQEIYVYDGSAWVKTSNSNWLSSGNTLSTGSFLGATNDVGMDIRSNNISLLQFGRRQTLGLTQTYPDYNDKDQYLTYVKGDNGTSAIQFQADAADFYKPMFFTNSQGNFRLKGSAAGTDFFELGSAGVSNAGIMEFIIGDDGAEPFIFKRYDYRDQLNKELFRIQGSADSQDALPRVGINTGQLANSTLEVNGSIATAITSPSSSLTLNETHHTVLVDSNRSITLPSANTCEGRTYIIKNTHDSAITISTFVDNTGTNSTSVASNSVVQLQSDGSSWHSITPGLPTFKYSQTFAGRAYFYNNIWYAPNATYGLNLYWNQSLGTGSTATYTTSASPAGIPIARSETLTKFIMKNDFNANPSGTQQINLSVLRGSSFISIGTYNITGGSTSISIQNQDVNFELQENDLLVWACRTSSGANRYSTASITFEFAY
ncbi:hypothetical protein R3X28_17540 [Maribacter sp. TH_r10]|uniref:hypothetical protein n=1 Tax=Maribacter sp. TH_r10 TaxID=3082086 RepID=UPI002953978A|nr:hypothetical protein [Maribacter sp. TH_r10]MDV7140700.1 hypothetical protein [Maribacter sp. TH_r10]